MAPLPRQQAGDRLVDQAPPTEDAIRTRPPGEDAGWLRVENALRAALREIRYGSLEVVIHGGRVVQIERREKLRWSEEREP